MERFELGDGKNSNYTYIASCIFDEAPNQKKLAWEDLKSIRSNFKIYKKSLKYKGIFYLFIVFYSINAWK